jgi:uncharacterized protein (TIGR01244 family)
VRHGRKLLAAVLPMALGAAIAVGAGIEEIEGYYRVSAEVATGSQPTDAQVAEIGEAGFRTLLSLREPSEFDEAAEAEAARRAGMRFLSIPVAKGLPTAAAVAEFLKVTDDREIYPVFIHCSSGNRVGALWMIRRILRDGWSLEEAEAEADGIGLTSEKLREWARDYVREHTTKAVAGASGSAATAGGRP